METIVGALGPGIGPSMNEAAKKTQLGQMSQTFEPSMEDDVTAEDNEDF